MQDITYKDNERYMAVLHQGKTTRWICRFYFNTANKYLALPTDDKKEEKIMISNIYEIENCKDALIKSASRFAGKK